MVALVKIILQFMVQDLEIVVGLLAEGVEALMRLMEITPEMVGKAVVEMAQIRLLPHKQVQMEQVALLAVVVTIVDMGKAAMVVLVQFLLDG